MTVAMRPKSRAPGTYALRQRAAAEPAVYAQWLDAMRTFMQHIDPVFREQLIAWHEKVGPLSQYHDLMVIDQFDVQDRISTLKPPLLLIRGLDDPSAPEAYEQEIHQAVPGSQYITLRQAGHFPMAEQPAVVNQAIAAFLDIL
jgi:pimeloyl-ACP methyl ester carboxylesterase